MCSYDFKRMRSCGDLIMQKLFSVLLNIVLVADILIKFLWCIYALNDPLWWWGGSILVVSLALFTKKFGKVTLTKADVKWYDINWTYVFFKMWGPVCIISALVHSMFQR